MGFLSIEFTREQLHRINSELGIFVAVREKKVIGYLMAETVEFAIESPLISHMLKRLKDTVFDGLPLSRHPACLYMDLSALTGNNEGKAFFRAYSRS